MNVLNFADEDQQVVFRAVAEQVRAFADSRRRGKSKAAADLSDEFRADYFEAANRVIGLWLQAGAPLPSIQGFERLADGSFYESDGEQFMGFVRALVFGHVTGNGDKV